MENDACCASILVPAHNEGATIERLIRSLADAARCVRLEIVIVCNGCTDDTADRARSAAPGAMVLESPKPSKHDAVMLADAAASYYPRIICDADVELSAGSVDELVRPLVDGVAHATAPTRLLPTDKASPIVRSYYAFWEALPQVQTALFGRGVIALSAEGFTRFRALPPMMSDDLAISELFAAGERAVVKEASVVVRPPRTARDLVRRRIRVITGNAQADAAGMRGDSARTTWRTIGQLLRARPRLFPHAATFVLVTALARVLAHRYVRRGDVTTWLRDDSSRR